MKTIKYSVSNVGRDAKNPLLDIHQTDEQWYFDTLVNMTSTCSDIGQYKGGNEEGEFAWNQLIRRRPKQLSIGKNGPNSIFTLITGLLTNYIKNKAKYGVCRISKKQTEDLEFACLFFNAIDSANFEPIQWKQVLFSQGEATF